MNKHVNIEVAVPHYGPSEIDRLIEQLDRDSKQLDFLLNTYSCSEYQAPKINAAYAHRRLQRLADTWASINEKINGQ